MKPDKTVSLNGYSLLLSKVKWLFDLDVYTNQIKWNSTDRTVNINFGEKDTGSDKAWRLLKNDNLYTKIP